MGFRPHMLRPHMLRKEREMLKIMCLAVTLALAMPGLALAQNVASNKSFFYKSTDGITLAAVSKNGFSKPVPVFDASQTLKTSNGGAVNDPPSPAAGGRASHPHARGEASTRPRSRTTTITTATRVG